MQVLTFKLFNIAKNFFFVNFTVVIIYYTKIILNHTNKIRHFLTIQTF